MNSGYESETSFPDIAIPARLAEELAIWPQLKEEAIMLEGVSFGGPTRAPYLEGCVEVEVITQDRVEGPIVAGVAIGEFEEEVLFSNSLTSALKMALEDVGLGLWRFRDEGLDRLRRTELPEYWR